MLNQLSIRNFAIIDDISVSFINGLTVLTGETGAGKSIIIDAVQLLAGARASVDYVRHGEAKAEIIGMFDIVHNETKIIKKCKAYDIDYDADELFILERTITANGKSVCRVNGKIVTLAVLRSFGQLLVHIHSQHDHVHLMDTKTHIHLLDAFHAKKLQPLLKNYAEKFAAYDTYRKEFESLNQDEQQLAHRLDLLLFQQQEINAADLKEDEDIHLEKERNELQNFATVYDAISTAYEALNGDNKALELIDIANKAFSDHKLNETEWKEYATKLESIYYQLEEMTFEIRHAQDDLFFDEDRLNEIESRLNLISQLKRKYGSDVNDIIAYEKQITEEIDTIQNREAHHEQLIQHLEEAKQAAYQIALELSEARQKAANALTKQIQAELKDLYLHDTVFEVAFLHADETKLSENGIDSIQFLLATNKGEPLKELHKVASGGEISRIMLALKKIFAKHDKIGTVIFDEIDTGVSGRVAQAIAEKMYEIAKTTQVLCITHLAQVAAMSDHHLLIKKIEKEKRTTTSVQSLSLDEKTNEIGKMITGSELTDTAIDHANQLLRTMEKFKAQ